MKKQSLKKICAHLLSLVLVVPAVFGFSSILNAQTDLRRITNEPIDRSIPSGFAEYIIYVKTSDEFEAGTDSNISMTINGDGQDGIAINNLKQGVSTGEFAFSGETSQTYDSGNVNDPGGRGRITVTWGSQKAARVPDANYFERDSITRINVIAKNVGNITSITVRKDNFGSAPDWKLQYIKIIHKSRELTFSADKWFRSGSNTHTFSSSFSKVGTYEVQTYTGDLPGAGTDSNIFLTIEGVDDDGTVVILPEIRLNGLGSGNLFERNSKDTVKTGNMQVLRQIKSITIRSDNKYAGSAWYLSWIKISGTTFLVNDWIDSGKLTKVLLNPSFRAPQPAGPNYSQKSPVNTRHCQWSQWYGVWNTNKGPLVINEDAGTIQLVFENGGRNLRNLFMNNPCELKLGEYIASLNRFDIWATIELREDGSFAGNIVDESGVHKWSGQKQTASTVPLPNPTSNAATNSTANVCSAADWVGTWKTTLFPEMTIKLEFGKGYTGVFSPANFPFTANIEGNACVINGFWKDNTGSIVGAFRFTMSDKGNFAGAYVGKNDLNQDLSSKPQTWRGNKVGAAAVAASTTIQPNIPAPAPSAIPVNLSVGKFARQSSVDFGGVAGRAVDGNTDGNWYNNSVTHTVGENGGWWEVDLGAVYNISEIKLYNRTDCCSDRLKQFRISVSSQPFSSNSDGVEYAPLQGYVTTNPWVFGRSTEARYVRIYLNGSGVLSLAEVQVYGTPVN